MHTCVCMCKYTCFFLCVFFWLYLTAGCLTLWFSSIQVSFVAQQPVVGPATRRFCRAFIASVSVCVSRGCVQSAVVEWKCWMCVRVCTYECIWRLFDLKSNACCTGIAPQDCIYKHEYTRTYMYRQTERHSGWISDIEYNRLPMATLLNTTGCISRHHCVTIDVFIQIEHTLVHAHTDVYTHTDSNAHPVVSPPHRFLDLDGNLRATTTTPLPATATTQSTTARWTCFQLNKDVMKGLKYI
jgi:hypothetical protein